MGVAEAVSSLFAILCFLPLSQIWSYEFFFLSKGIRRAQICLTVQQILGNFIKRRDQSCSKDLYVLCRKTVCSGIELRSIGIERDQSCSKDLYVLCRKTVRSGIELRI